MAKMNEPPESEMEVDPPAAKGTPKLSRGEKSRIAAKSRRDKEVFAMQALMDELPVPNETLNKLDKAAVVKLAVSYIKIKHFVQKDIGTYGNQQAIAPPTPTDIAQKTQAEGQLMLEALNGFLIFVSKKGTIKFVSTTVQDHLGHKQEQMIGRSIMEYIHINDQHEFHKHFKEDDIDTKKVTYRPRPTGRLCDEPQRVFYLRMKFNLPKPGTKSKHSGYLLVQWSGKMKRHLSMKTGQCTTDGLLCICRPMQTTPLLEIRMDGNMFMSRHDLSMMFTFCDTRILTLIGYEPNEVVGKTAYHFHNPIDAPKVSDCHQNLILKGSSVSKYYRFLGKNDNWVWLQTRATIIYNTANKPQYIVCMNYVISEEEGERYLMLEEHQLANKLTENTILTLPDNQHHDPICHPPHTMGPRIKELDSVSHVPSVQCPKIKELGTTEPRIKELDPENIVQTARFPPNSCTPVVVPDQVTCTDVDMDNVSQMVATPLESFSSSALSPPDVDTLDLNAPVDSPTTPTTLSNNGSPQSASSSEACGYSYMDQQLDSYTGPVSLSCGSNYSNTDSDPGYASADSPYSGHYSPQIVSPGCSTEMQSGAYGSEYNKGFIQGQNCPMSSAMGQDCASPMSAVSSDINDITNADQVLDNILNQLNCQSNEFNIDEVFSTYQNVINQCEPPVSTYVRSPGSAAPLTPKPVQRTSPPTVDGSQAKAKPSSVLRSILTMPEKDLAKTIAPKKGNHSKNPAGCSGQPVGFSAQTITSPQSVMSQQSVMSPQCKQSDSAFVGGDYSHQSPMSTCQDDMLQFSEIPEDISDFAMKYLVDDIMDSQAQAIISDLQKDDDDCAMDTSDDLTQALLSSLESQCSQSVSQGTTTGFSGSNVGNISTSQPPCGNGANTNSPFSCQQPSAGCRPAAGPSNSVSSGKGVQRGNSSHDHVYHQNCNRSRSQKIPENGLAGCFSRPVTNTNCSRSCSSQTQSSEYCLSELNRHLRNRRAENSQASDTSTLSTSPKPFLEQLLTGELTKDMYMTMERKRFQDGTGISPP